MKLRPYLQETTCYGSDLGCRTAAGSHLTVGVDSALDGLLPLQAREPTFAVPSDADEGSNHDFPNIRQTTRASQGP